ncbi:UDP-N-acetylglucosamine--undecaprenyl-phosphate N-acetylglucosaminephosphotransferase [Paraglaciecola sp.]|uniref:UDP-N-acetylglucosamine--undecaprenyl-phosphate N-acetylglucosaminephosphotransferase n=1 Tax=Paraglaciecola sp. TaxID=1920173 RepID=UPI0030F45CB3
MLSIISISLFAFITCFTCVLTFRPIAIGVGLVDKPSGRKQHSGDIPLVGGLAIYVAVIFSSFLFIHFDSNYKLYLISTSFMVLIGALDDYYDLDSGLRLIAQFLIASLMVFGANIYISNLGNIFGRGDIDLGFLGPIFTMLAVVAAINAFNMMDGVDGLVGSLSINTFLSIGILAFLSNTAFQTDLPAMFLGAIFAFLVFNFGRFKSGKYKVFMGDAGSMLVGLSLIWLLTFATRGEGSLMRPITAVWLIGLPLIDMFSVMFRRVKSGNSPLKASRDHIHHIFLSNGFSNKTTTLSISLISAIFCAVGVLSELILVNEVVMTGLFITIFVIYNAILMTITKNK